MLERIGTRRRLALLVRAFLLSLLLAWTNCSSATLPSEPLVPTDRTAPASLGDVLDDEAPHTVVLVAVDGVRWQDVFWGVEAERARKHGLLERELLEAQELMPNLHQLARSGTAIGAHGRALFATGPEYLSKPGYTEMCTGVAAHGCLNNGCARTRHLTIADRFAERADPSDVAVIASWPGVGIAATKDPTALTLSAGRTGGATRNRMRYDNVSTALFDAAERLPPAPGHGDFRPDSATAEIALYYLRTHRPRFLFLGLGETDEYAHRNDYRNYLRALVHADRVVGEVASILASYEREGRRTTLVVTTDHGRAHDFANHGAHAPESRAVWAVASGWGIRRGGLTSPEATSPLASVGQMIGALAKLTEPAENAALEAFLSPAVLNREPVRQTALESELAQTGMEEPGS